MTGRTLMVQGTASSVGEAGIAVRYVTRPGDLEAADLVVLPGSKCTVGDLGWLRESGIAAAVAAGGAVVGTLVHGLFEDESVRAALLGSLRARRGLPPPRARALPTREEEYDRLARAVLENVDWQLLCRIVGVALPPPTGSPS